MAVFTFSFVYYICITTNGEAVSYILVNIDVVNPCSEFNKKKKGNLKKNMFNLFAVKRRVR